MTSIDQAIAAIKTQGLLEYATKFDSRFAEEQTWTTAQVVALMRSEAERSLTRNTEPATSTQEAKRLDPRPWVDYDHRADVYATRAEAPGLILMFSPAAQYEQDPSRYPLWQRN